MDSFQASYSEFKGFPNLASNLMRYSRFLIVTPLLFIAESRYSPYCLLRRVAFLIYSRESLLTAESYLQKHGRTPTSLQGTMTPKMDFPCRILLTLNILKEWKIWVVKGSIFDSPLLLTAGSPFFHNLCTNNFTKIQPISKPLLGTSIETRISRLIKKIGVKNIVGLSL
jgi:hypothetical protein